MKFLKTFNIFVNETNQSMILYHGSNKKFDDFEDSKIGTGEGNLFGKGYYLTDNPEIAVVYAKQMAKKDHATGYSNGTFDIPEPIYPANIEDLIRDSIHVNTFKVTGNFFDANTTPLDDDLQNYIADLFAKYSGFGDTEDCKRMAFKSMNFVRDNSYKIRNFRGELEYVIKQLAHVDVNMTEDIINYIKKLGYDGIKYSSDLDFEELDGNNYVIFNKNCIKPI